MERERTIRQGGGLGEVDGGFGEVWVQNRPGHLAVGILKCALYVPVD